MFCKSVKSFGVFALIFDQLSPLSLIRSILPYATVVWNQITITDKCQLERVHQKHFKSCVFVFGIKCSPHDYSSAPLSYVLRDFKSLVDRRVVNNVILLKIINFDIVICNAPQVLANIGFLVCPLNFFQILLFSIFLRVISKIISCTKRRSIDRRGLIILYLNYYCYCSYHNCN